MPDGERLNELRLELSSKTKISEIAKRSDQLVVLCGPSGSGKTMVIKHLVRTYGFIEPPFITTRPLREGEEMIGGKTVRVAEYFHLLEDSKVFLPARNYGNAYGYFTDDIYQYVIDNNRVLVEAPGCNLTTDVSHYLPRSTIIALLPATSNELVAQIASRGNIDSNDLTLRIMSAEIEKEHIRQAAKTMCIAEIVPTPGSPDYTLQQIDLLMKSQDRRDKFEYEYFN